MGIKMNRSGLVLLGLCLLCWAFQACAPATDTGTVSLDLGGEVLLEGETNHSGINVRVAFDDGALVGQTQSDADGAFVFRGVPQSTFRLTFSKDGFDTQADVVAVFDGGSFVINEGQAVVLRPDRSASLSGRLESPLEIQDWNGSATVTLAGNGPEVSFAPNGDGRFEQRDLRPGTYGLEVRAQGHLPYSTVVVLNTQERFVLEQPIVLTPEVQNSETTVLMRGQVTLDGAADSAGVQVRVEVGGQLYATLQTDAEGHFVLPTSRLTHTLSFSKDGYRLPVGQPETIVALWAEDEALADGGRFEVDGQWLEGLNFELEPLPTATLRGTVSSTLGELSDWPARGFVTLVSNDTQARRIEPVVDGEAGRGQFQFAGLVLGQYTLSVSVQGHRPFTQAVELVQGDNALGNIELESVADSDDEAVVLRGQACKGGCDSERDHSGILINATIGVVPVGTIVTDAQGRFALRTSPLENTLEFQAQGFVTQRVDVGWSEVEEQFEAVTVELPEVATATLRGALTSPLNPQDWPERAFVTLASADASIQRIATVATEVVEGGTQGTFEIAGLPEGEYTLVVAALGHRSVTRVVEVPAGGLSLEVPLTPTEVVFAGQVLSAAVPVPSVIVRARRDGVLADTTLTDELGDFVLRLTPESHTLTLSREGFLAHPEVTLRWNGVGFDVESPVDGEPPFKLTPLPLATLRGEVSSGQGARNDWANIASATLVGQDLRRIVSVFNADNGRGQFQFAALPPGEYTLTIVAQGHVSFVGEVVLNEGDNSLAEALGQEFVVLAPQGADEGVTLSGRVVLQGQDGDDGDNSDVSVAALVEGNLVATVSTTPGGLFAFAAARQDHQLTLTHPGYIERNVSVVWDEVDERFEVGGEALALLAIVLTQEPQSDRDNDGVIDVLDNCPDIANPGADDFDGDGLGDVCDGDIDGDLVANLIDNCPLAFNPTQEDVDGDGVGVACRGGRFDALCGVRRHRVSTAGNADRRRGQCGGGAAPEISYQVVVESNTVLQASAQADFAVVWYLVDAQEQEVLCDVGASLTLTGPGAEADDAFQVPPGVYELVLDGFVGDEAAGPVTVDIATSRCERRLVVGGTINQRERSFTELAIGDVTGDGLVDVVGRLGIEFERRNQLCVMTNFGGGSFGNCGFDFGERNLIYDDIALGDVDGDGIQEIISISRTQNVLDVKYVTPEGVFNDTVRHVESSPLALAVGDVDEDGLIDIVVTNTALEARVLLGQGDGRFVFTGVPLDMGFARNVTLKDVNADGHLDCIGSVTGPNIIKVFLGDGLGGFGAEIVSGSGIFDPELAMGDLNEDGFLDVAILSGTDVRLMMGQGDGTFVLSDTLNLGDGRRGSFLAVADVFGDSALDLVVSGFPGSETYALRGHGDGTFVPAETFILGGQPVGVAVGELDGDGLQDVAFIENSGGSLLDIRLVRGDSASAALRSALTSTSGQRPSDDNVVIAIEPEVSVADVNGDGLLDLVSGRVELMLGDGQGRLLSAGMRQTAGTIGAPIIADFSGDGVEDIVTVSEGGIASLLIGLGGGAFLPAVETALSGSDVTAAAAIDVDGDGAFELALLYRADERADTTSLGVLRSALNGSFETVASVAVGADVPFFFGALNVLDLDGDGDLDLVAEALGIFAAVILNDGNGGLAVGETMQMVSDGVFIDLNADGLMDYLEPRGRVFIANPNLSFTVLLAVDGRPENEAVKVLAGDLNGDGLPDRVALSAPSVDQGPGEVYVAMATNIGVFDDALRLPVRDLRDAVLVDVNGDDSMDIAALSDDALLLFLGRGDGTFGPAQVSSFDASLVQRRFLSADMNDDGLGDVVVLQRASGDASPFAVHVFLGSPANESVDVPSDANPRRVAGALTLGSTLPPCAPQSFPTERLEDTLLVWRPEAQNPCRVTHVALSFEAIATSGTARLEAAQLTQEFQIPDDAQRLTWLDATVIPSLARFEGHTLAGAPWSLTLPFAPSGAMLHINPSIEDPWAPETSAALCGGGDQATAPQALCVWDAPQQLEFVLEDELDEDVFLLAGSLGGAFAPNEHIEVTIATEPDAVLQATLQTFRGRAPLATAVEMEAGLWRLNYTVPQDYAQRTLALHVVAVDVDALPCTLTQ